MTWGERNEDKYNSPRELPSRNHFNAFTTNLMAFLGAFILSTPLSWLMFLPVLRSFVSLFRQRYYLVPSSLFLPLFLRIRGKGARNGTKQLATSASAWDLAMVNESVNNTAEVFCPCITMRGVRNSLENSLREFSRSGNLFVLPIVSFPWSWCYCNYHISGTVQNFLIPTI